MNEKPTRDRESLGKLLSSDADEQGAVDEAWGAWEQLLDAASVDDASLVNERALAQGVFRRISQRRARKRKLILAAAAAALLAVTTATWFAPRRERDLAGPANARERTSAALVSHARWESDRLDFDLSLARWQAAAVERQWQRPVDELALLREQMNELEAEIGSDPLLRFEVQSQ